MSWSRGRYKADTKQILELMTKMHSPVVIAAKFIELERQETEQRGEPFEGMCVHKLMRLVYIAHGVHLVRTDKPLTSAAFEAWKCGPVCPELLRYIKRNMVQKEPIELSMWGRFMGALRLLQRKFSNNNTKA